jgi:hypothetical protein
VALVNDDEIEIVGRIFTKRFDRLSDLWLIYRFIFRKFDEKLFIAFD